MSTQPATPAPDTGDDLIALLDKADELPAARVLRARTYDLLEAPPRAPVVDVGCGAGRAIAELNERGAVATGIDPDETMLAAARRRWPEADFRAGTADDLPFADGSMRGYRADKVFHNLTDPAAALREARRVLAPSGRVVLLGQDWDAIVIDSGDAELTRTIVRARAALLPSPRAARRFRNLLLDTGFADVAVEVYPGVFTDETMLPMLSGLAVSARAAGAITEEQASRWTDEQAARAEAGRLFLVIPMFLAAATNPEPAT